MATTNLIMSSKSSNMKLSIYPPLQLSPKQHHEMALIRLETYHSIPNIDESNNVLRYDLDSASNDAMIPSAGNDSCHDVIIPTGAYELTQINDIIQSQVPPQLFELMPNKNTLKCIIRIHDPKVRIHFDHDESMRDLLGFETGVIEGVGDHEGSSIVNILKVNSILVNCDVITGSYVNASQEPVLYSFFPNVPPGYKVVETPGTPIYLPISHTRIDCIRLWLTDQDKNPINLRGETLTVSLVIRSSNK